MLQQEVSGCERRGGEAAQVWRGWRWKRAPILVEGSRPGHTDQQPTDDKELINQQATRPPTALTAHPSRSWGSPRPTTHQPRCQAPAPHACPCGGEEKLLAFAHCSSFGAVQSAQLWWADRGVHLRTPTEAACLPACLPAPTRSGNSLFDAHLGDRPVLAPDRVASAPAPTMWVEGSYLSACSYSSGTLQRWGAAKQQSKDSAGVGMARGCPARPSHQPHFQAHARLAAWRGALPLEAGVCAPG